MMWRARAYALVLCTSIAIPALADPTKRECIDANGQAQVELKAGHLRAAERALQSCAVRACPTQVRKDCAGRLDALLPRIPTLVIEAKDPTGNDVTAVSVRVDGELLTERLDGTAIELDPGEHHFTFEANDASPVVRTIVIREGEVARREKVVIGKAPVVQIERDPASPPASVRAASADPGKGQRTAGLVVGGVGVVGLVAGAIFAGVASSKWASSKGYCSTDPVTKQPSATCATGDNLKNARDAHDAASTFAAVSTVGFIAGGVLAAGGVVLYLTAPRARSKVGIVPAANAALLVGSF